MIKTRISRPLTLSILFVLLAPPLGGARQSFTVLLWPDGRVPYPFEVSGHELTDDHKTMVRTMMKVWEDALTLRDPANHTKPYINFFEVVPTAQPSVTSYVLIRYNDDPDSDQNMCSYKVDNRDVVGMNPTGATIFRFKRNQDANTILHELGHCLGLWHEFNRTDADRWLVESEAVIQDPSLWDPEERAPEVMPLLGNYDYDSITHYRSYKCVISPCPPNPQTLLFRDRLRNAFSRYEGGEVVSERDISRLLQYYAHNFDPSWQFFTSLSFPLGSADPDALPNPYLASGHVKAVGTPSTAFQSAGNFDLIVRGSDNHLYWGMFRNGATLPASWVSLGCCFGSDPAAVSQGEGHMAVVAIGAVSRKLLLNQYQNGAWDHWSYVQGGYPSGGIKPDLDGGYIGPAIASRGVNSLDIFVVRSNGWLAVTTLRNGTWTPWSTLGSGYNVTARPAAVALSETGVQLAINENDINLYEPYVTFPPLVPSFSLGIWRGRTYPQAPPALAKWHNPDNPYHILITNIYGRLSHRFALGTWRDIGGILQYGTGPSAVATGPYSAYIVMNGEDALGCDLRCIPRDAPAPGAVIQPGGLWLRKFEAEVRPR